MKFPDLYAFCETHSILRAAAGKNPFVVFVMLRDEVIKGVDWLTQVNVYPVESKEGDPFGHYECHGEGVESAHEQPEEWLALISYNGDPAKCNRCWQRMVWTKELMHVFDTDEGVVNLENYRGFLQEVEVRPPHEEQSAAYISENAAKWMALLCLCPKTQRDAFKIRYEQQEITTYQVASAFRIPKDFVNLIFSDSYDIALKIYVTNAST